MLESFSPGELQAGAFIDRPYKDRSGDISIISQRNRGTGIPASTWARMQSGLIKPGPTTLRKLSLFKQRFQYNTLRGSGVPENIAKRLSRSELSTAMNEAAIYRAKAEKIAKALSFTQNKKIDPEWILYNMMKGERKKEDWDKYITALTV